MKFRLSLIVAVLAVMAVPVRAADFGVHAGYYGQDLKAAYLGVDWMASLGPAVIMPNIDYSRKSGIDYWFGSVDLDLKVPMANPSIWFGAGPTYGYINAGGVHSNNWGWDVNGGVGWSAIAVKPYVTLRYIKIKDFKTTGAAIGLRF